MIIDEELIRQVMSVAGKDIHDICGAISIYRNSKWIVDTSKEDNRLTEVKNRNLFLFEKYERILRSFLVTKDLKESKKLVENSEWHSISKNMNK